MAQGRETPFLPGFSSQIPLQARNLVSREEAMAETAAEAYPHTWSCVGL